METQHSCEAVQGSWHLLSDCTGAGITTGAVVGTVVAVLALVAAGIGIWFYVRDRHS